jgi:hypothetical protein
MVHFSHATPFLLLAYLFEINWSKNKLNIFLKKTQITNRSENIKMLNAKC